MNNSITVDWGGNQVKLTWIPSDQLPDEALVTSVHGYCFHQNKVLLVHVEGRGFNIPGGHVEEVDETPEHTLHREAYEEGYVKGNVQYLGMIEVNNEDNPLYDPDGKYPFIGYQLFYRMDITECHPFLRENECTSRIWVEPSEIPYIMNDHELSLLVLEEAMKKV
ncbi:MAG: NUDIX domain-containing protein [Bacilli bacterium]